MPHPTPVEQMDLVLEYLEAKTGPDRLPVPLDPKTDYAIAYAQGNGDDGLRDKRDATQGLDPQDHSRVC
jgi:hypothetical protein